MVMQSEQSHNVQIAYSQYQLLCVVFNAPVDCCGNINTAQAVYSYISLFSSVLLDLCFVLLNTLK